ncbi:MAG: PEGA domain-containing protein [Archangiaceae bacterium]|nr:PEGA domain-containing protein [Archangiaceae bacterium]
MSDLNEGPGELPPELREFYDAHRDTGEPTGAQLGKALLRVHSGTRPAAPMTLSRRRWLPPELLAVAALLLLTIGGGAIGWYLKTESLRADAMLFDARAAWVAGDLDAAIASLDRCGSDDCVRLAAAVKRAKTQLKQQAPLEAAEKGSLLALDLELSAGQRSVIADQISPRAPQSDRDLAEAEADALLRQGFPPEVVSRAVALFIAGLEVSASTPELATRNFREVVALVPGTTLARRAEKRMQPLVGPTPPEQIAEPPPAPVVEAAPSPADQVDTKRAALLEQGKRAKKEKNFGAAITALEQCLALSRGDLECTLTLATTYAARGTDENSQVDNEKARALYVEFLRIAPPDDRRISRVQAILGEPLDEAARAPDPHDLYLRGYQLRESAPDEARRLFEEVVRLAPTSIDGQKAKARIAELGTRSPMGRLRIASVPTNARVFIDGVDTGRNTPVLPGDSLEVTPGRHTIYAEAGGRRSSTTQLTVVEGDNPVIQLTVQ